MDSEGVGSPDKDLCQRAWCLFEFATTLSLGNVLSFRLGHLRKRRTTKQLTQTHLNHLPHSSNTSCNSLTTSSLEAHTSTDENNNHGHHNNTSADNTSTSGGLMTLRRASSIILNNMFPVEFRILDTMEVVWAKPSKVKRHAKQLDVKHAKCRVESDMDNVIRPKLVLLGKGDLKRGYEVVNETVKQGMSTLQELLEWRDNELSYAAFNGQMELLKKLLASGDDPNQPDKTDKTPLHRACKAGTSKAVALLLDAGAQIDARDRDRNTPLHFAAQTGHIQCVHTLLVKGADPDAKNRTGATPLELAQQQQVQQPQHQELGVCAQLLLEARKKRRGRSNSLTSPLALPAAVQAAVEAAPAVSALAPLSLHAGEHTGNKPLHPALKKKASLAALSRQQPFQSAQ